MQFIEETPEVLYVRDRLINLTKDTITTLLQQAQSNPRQRARICTHDAPTAPQHEMLIAMAHGNYVRPHRHVGKSESYHMISGSANFVLFDDGGDITDVLELGAQDTGKTFYCRIPERVFHTLIFTANWSVYHETTTGPLSREATEFADWSPAQEATEAKEAFMHELSERVDTFLRDGTRIDP